MCAWRRGAWRLQALIDCYVSVWRRGAWRPSHWLILSLVDRLPCVCEGARPEGSCRSQAEDGREGAGCQGSGGWGHCRSRHEGGRLKGQCHDQAFFTWMQCCGSGMFIPDPGSKRSRNRIRIKEFKYFWPRKLFISSRKYEHPGSGTRVRIFIFYPFRIPGPGVLKAPDPGSGSATLLEYLIRNFLYFFILTAEVLQ